MTEIRKSELKLEYLVVHLLLVLTLLAMAQHAVAGKYPYAEFHDTVAYEAIEVLKKHGMPVEHDRVGNYWFYISGNPGSYTLSFHRADEIPQQAVLDIVKLCMNFYVQRGRKERFYIVMYQESQEEWRESLFFGVATLTTMKPFFELTIGREGGDTPRHPYHSRILAVACAGGISGSGEGAMSRTIGAGLGF